MLQIQTHAHSRPNGAEIAKSNRKSCIFAGCSRRQKFSLAQSDLNLRNSSFHLAARPFFPSSTRPISSPPFSFSDHRLHRTSITAFPSHHRLSCGEAFIACLPPCASQTALYCPPFCRLSFISFSIQLLDSKDDSLSWTRALPDSPVRSPVVVIVATSAVRVTSPPWAWGATCGI